MNPLVYYIIITFFFFSKNFVNNLTNRFIFLLLFLSIINEFLTKYLVSIKFPYALNTTLFIVIHNFIWISILKTAPNVKKWLSLCLSGYITFSLCNILFFEGINKFNYYSFLLGAFIYLILFIYESYIQLKNENFRFFISNQFILYSAPVLFFMCFSVLFGFKSHSLGDIIVYNEIILYDLISYSTNIVYYSLINFYIFKEKKLQNAS